MARLHLHGSFFVRRTYFVALALSTARRRSASARVLSSLIIEHAPDFIDSRSNTVTLAVTTLAAAAAAAAFDLCLLLQLESQQTGLQEHLTQFEGQLAELTQQLTQQAAAEGGSHCAVLC